MNKWQAKKEFRMHVFVFPYVRRSRAGIWKTKRARASHKEMMEYGK